MNRKSEKLAQKQGIRDLAIFGGMPAFADTLHVGKPNLGDRDAFISRLREILDARWFTNNGPVVQEFERRIEELIGVRHCIAMCNGTVALEIAVRALQMRGEVIVPSFTFVATAHCLQWQEITPVFCDIDPVTYTLDPQKLEQLITPKTTGIIGVHLWGNVCPHQEIEQIAERHGLRVLYDASHAFNVSLNGRMIGNLGLAEVFSFHATKFVNSFEGGAVVTNDDNLAKQMRLMKNFGFSGMDNVVYLGINGKISEPCAAMGITSLENIDEFVSANKANYIAYREGLADVPGCNMSVYDEKEHNNYQYIIVEIEEEEFGMSRDDLMWLLHRENIRARRYFYPGVHNMEPYRRYYPNAGLLLPVTNNKIRTTLCLPTGTAVSPQQVQDVASLIEFTHINAGEIKSLLGQAS